MNKKITDMNKKELSEELDRINKLIPVSDNRHITQLVARKSVVIDELDMLTD